MGNQQSAVYNRISRILPTPHETSWWEDGDYFVKSKDRDQLIHAIIALISSNGSTSLEETDFKLLFSRTPDDNLVCTLAAYKGGVIVGKIEPPLAGNDRTEAFRSFKKHVEVNLHGLLEGVPDVAEERRVVLEESGSSLRGVVSASRRSSQTTLMTTSDLPPAYGETQAGGSSEVGKRI